MMIIGVVWISAAEITAQRKAQRGAVLAIETEFKSDVKVQAAFLTWQTYDSISPEQSGMATAFRCAADVVPNGTSPKLSCKVPFDVADGHYCLTSIFVKTSECEREYNFQRDLPTDVEVDIKGGKQISVPDFKPIQLK